MFYYFVFICGLITTIMLFIQKRREKKGKSLKARLLVIVLIVYWISILILFYEAFARLGAAYLNDIRGIPQEPGDIATGFNLLFSSTMMLILAFGHWSYGRKN